MLWEHTYCRTIPFFPGDRESMNDYFANIMYTGGSLVNKKLLLRGLHFNLAIITRST